MGKLGTFKRVIVRSGLKHSKWKKPQSLSQNTDDLGPALKKAKDACTNLAFKAGSEQHGDCVMRLLAY